MPLLNNAGKKLSTAETTAIKQMMRSVLESCDRYLKNDYIIDSADTAQESSQIISNLIQEELNHLDQKIDHAGNRNAEEFIESTRTFLTGESPESAR